MRRFFSTIILVMLASLAIAQAPVVSRQKAQPQKSGTPSKPAQQKPATQPTTPKRPTTGVLTITSTPSDASVKLDNDYLGTTPITIRQQRPGTYTITFSAEGYETRSKTVTVTAGETTTCSVTLVKKGQAAPTTNPTTSISASQSFTVKGVTFKMLIVEGGSFNMGATSDQGGDSESDEKPVHQVTLSSFYMGETEVTQALWQAVMGSNPSRFVGDSRPVERVSWGDCQTFIQELNTLTGRTFRLPTEAEWEYAARGGKKSRGCKYSGSNILGNVAWFEDNSGRETHPVKTKSPNELGLYDMSGNVWEWCQDWVDSYTSSSQTNPTGPTSGSLRSNRGGCWSSDGGMFGCRVANRGQNKPDSQENYLGLRLALSSAASVTPATIATQPSFAGMTLEQIGNKGRELFDMQRFDEALPYIYEAAQRGHTDAEFLMGYLSYNGKAVEQNFEHALYWYRKAIEQGSVSAMNNIGLLYEKGQGVRQDYTEAVKWYRKAADNGSSVGQCNLGWYYEMGYGVAKDWSQAAYWYRKSAEQGLPRGEYCIGWCYYNGKGVDMDKKEAYRWLKKAADHGFQQAKTFIDEHTF